MSRGKTDPDFIIAVSCVMKFSHVEFSAASEVKISCIFILIKLLTIDNAVSKNMIYYIFFKE